MPVPVWDSDVLYEPLDTATVVSDDIWKKFDLDVPLEHYHTRYQREFLDDGSAAISTMPPQCEAPMMIHFDRFNCQASSEIRHHDCMWAGLCVSKEHSRTHLAKKDPQVTKRVLPGRSLLIKNSTQSQQQQNVQISQQHSYTQQHSVLATSSYQSTCRTRTKNLESDGDSARPETPQSSGESEEEEEEEDDDEEEEEEEDEEEEEEEYEPPMFRHQISINDTFDTHVKVMDHAAVSEVTGQIRRAPVYDRRKEFEEARIKQEQAKSQESAIRNTMMSDHCYHLHQQPISASKKLDHLGVQTPSESEEEIDVVSCEKPSRPIITPTATSLPTFPSSADKQHFQMTVKTAFKDRHQSFNSSSSSPLLAPAPRPRGRPPSNATQRKRSAMMANGIIPESMKPAAKRARHRPYQRRADAPVATTPQKLRKTIHVSPKPSPSKSIEGTSRGSTSSDDEPDTEKRSLHNDMERKRRIELRKAYEDLRVLVPKIQDNEKAAKVTILREASGYCKQLTQYDQLKETQKHLLNHLSNLRRSLASRR